MMDKNILLALSIAILCVIFLLSGYFIGINRTTINGSIENPLEKKAAFLINVLKEEGYVITNETKPSTIVVMAYIQTENIEYFLHVHKTYANTTSIHYYMEGTIPTFWFWYTSNYSPVIMAYRIYE